MIARLDPADPDYNPNGWIFDRSIHSGDPSGVFQPVGGPAVFTPVYQASVPITDSGVAVIPASNAPATVTSPVGPQTGEVPIPAVTLLGNIPGWLQWALIAVAVYFIWQWAKGLK